MSHFDLAAFKDVQNRYVLNQIYIYNGLIYVAYKIPHFKNMLGTPKEADIVIKTIQPANLNNGKTLISYVIQANWALPKAVKLLKPISNVF